MRPLKPHATRHDALVWHAGGMAVFGAFASFIAHAKFAGAYSVTLWVLLLSLAAVPLMCAVVWQVAPPTARQVLGWAIATRLLAFWSTPFFEDDFYRYLWDGYQTIIGNNPYALAPSAFFSTNALVLDGVSAPEPIVAALSALNNPDIPTIYGPALQWLFALAAQVSPGALWPIRALWLAVDVWLIAVLITHCGARRAMLYALCPLVLHEVGVAAHPDGVMGALLLFAWVAMKNRQAWLCGMWLGCAAAMKIHLLLALPFLLIACGWGAPSVRIIAGCALTYASFWLPFVLPPIGSVDAFYQAWRSFATFARDWQFNALGFGLLRGVFDSSLARILAGGAMLFCWLGIAYFQIRQSHQKSGCNSAEAALVAAFGVLLFFSPVINAWYLLWLLPLAATTRLVTPWVASVVLPLSYLTHFNLGATTVSGGAFTPYALPFAIPIVEGIAIGLALCWDYRQATLRRLFRPIQAPVII